MRSLYQTENFLTDISLVDEPDKYGETIAVVYEHTKRTRDAVCRLRTIIQSFLCAQSGASIRLTIWKWSVQILYPGALLPVLENFHRTFSPSLTDCPWVSEDGSYPTGYTVCPLGFKVTEFLHVFFLLVDKHVSELFFPIVCLVLKK